MNETDTVDTWLEFKTAKLCLDCDAIFSVSKCPKCGGVQYMPLSRWIEPIESPVQDQSNRPPPVPQGPSPPLSELWKIGFYLGVGVFIGLAWTKRQT